MDPAALTEPDRLLHAEGSAFWRANSALALVGFTCFLLLYGTQPVLPQLTRTPFFLNYG